jgi:hypothetical protein
MGMSLQRTNWADQSIGNASDALRAQRCWPPQLRLDGAVAMRSSERGMSR